MINYERHEKNQTNQRLYFTKAAENEKSYRDQPDGKKLYKNYKASEHTVNTILKIFRGTIVE